MRLLKKKAVFLQSANAGNGTPGNFSIDLPSENAFDEDHLFKVYISRIHLRNSFLYVTNANSQFFWCVLPTTSAAPNAPTSVAVPGVWTPGNVPLGCPVDLDICNFMNALLVNPTNTYSGLNCALRNGRMYFNFVASSATTSAQYYVYLYFSNGTVIDRTSTLQPTGPANECFGFPSANNVYTIKPDHGGVFNAGTDASKRLNQYDRCPYIPTEVAMSPQLIDCNPLTDILVSTNLPTDNYCYSGGSLTNNGITVLLPVDQPPLGMLTYTEASTARAESRADHVMDQLLSNLYLSCETDQSQ